MPTQLTLRTAAPILLALVLAASAAPAAAQRDLFPTFSVRAGGYLIGNDITVELRGGDRVDLEKDFGLDGDKTLATVWLEWQPGERHLFRLGYYNLSLEGGRTIDRTIDWGDATYPAGASVTAELEQTVYEGDWIWWMYKREHGAFGTALGATVIEFTAQADGRLQVGQVVRESHQSAEATAPVPTLGLAGRVQPLSQLWLDAEVRILPGVQFDNVKGDALYVSTSAEWQALRHLNLGLNWTLFEVDADVDADRFDGHLDFTNSGTQAYVRFIF